MHITLKKGMHKCTKKTQDTEQKSMLSKGERLANFRIFSDFKIQVGFNVILNENTIS